MERQERIMMARQGCISNLNNLKCSIKQERHEDTLEFKLFQIPSTLGLRSMIAIGLFLFLFGMKQNWYQVKNFDCDKIVHMLEKDWSSYIEQKAEKILAYID